VEQVAIGLMLERGYEKVSVEEIAAAAGIGRTTFFRYFGSKPGVVWPEFDGTINRLAESLARSGSTDDVLGAVRGAVIESTRAALYSSEVWLERFKLLDTSAELRAGAQLRWEAWKLPISVFVADRTGDNAVAYVPMVIAAVCQAVFVAELRHWQNRDDRRDDLLARFDAHLQNVLAHLTNLLTDGADDGG
jgi:AcrR family transcriptional regulator